MSTYGYIKAAKMVVDSSHTLFIDSSNTALTAVNLDSERVVTDTLIWDNAYIPDPNTTDFILPTTGSEPKTANLTLQTLDIQGTSDFTGLATFQSLVSSSLVTDTLSGVDVTLNGDLSNNSLSTADVNSTSASINAATITFLDVTSLTSGNVSINALGTSSLNTNSLTATNLNAGSVSAGTVTAGNLISDNLVFGNLSTLGGFLVDPSANVNTGSKLNVKDDVSLADDVYANNNVCVKGNMSITNNVCIVQNKYIQNIVCVGGMDGSGNLQMWKGTSYDDPSGFMVTLNSYKLNYLLNTL